MRSLSFLGDVKLKWYRYLYLGDNARKAKYKTFGLIRKICSEKEDEKNR